MPYIVITGSNGFIGTNLVEKYLSISPQALSLSSSFEIFGSDLPESISRTNAQKSSNNPRYHYYDYEELLTTLEEKKEKPLLVIHNGACSSTTETNPVIFEKQNLGYSKSLWNFCTKNKIPFIYASSASVYGDGIHGFSDKKEMMPLFKPMNLYAKSKYDFDSWILEQKTNTPPLWFGLRYFNVYGQFEDHKKSQASMVFHGFNQAKSTGKIKLFKSFAPQDYKDGEQVRDFIYVDDIVTITLLLSEKMLSQKNKLSFPENGLFLNLGTGQTRTWNELATSIFNALNIPPHIEYIEMPNTLKLQYQNYTCADLSTFHSLNLGFSFVELQKGVYTYVTQYLAQGR